MCEEKLPSPALKGSNERGQSLVEFALGAIVFFLIVFGILDFGRAIYAYSVVASAAREGARYGAVHPDNLPGIESAVYQRAVGVVVAVESIDVEESEMVVTVSSQYGAVTPLIGNIVGSLTMRSTARQFREVLASQ
ncbi:MAG: TadE/TadG family type IV pilus assembly protein [Anaerolineae bacterium]